MTQGQLAEALGVEIETVNRYERGAIAPAFGRLERLCEVLEVPAWKLFSDGVSVPDATDSTVMDALNRLSFEDRDFILKFLKSYALHHKK
jgi:transcriptional regulator with XRE-family HTH domain